MEYDIERHWREGGGEAEHQAAMRFFDKNLRETGLCWGVTADTDPDHPALAEATRAEAERYRANLEELADS